jgi:Tol biopolymer transport system component
VLRLDMVAAIASLKSVFPQTDVKQALPWPLTFDPAGHRALYVFKGDLFLLHLATARFARLTDTEAEERSPEFSPDGERVAFVRTNDLYVVDISTLAETRLTRDGSEVNRTGNLGGRLV